MTVDQADKKLMLYRNAALSVYAKRLLAAGAEFEDKSFQERIIRYACQLEEWRTDAMTQIREYAAAAKAQRDEASTLH